jgi:hypothetical protein
MKLSYFIDTDWVIHYLNGNEKRDFLTGISVLGIEEEVD